MKREWIILLSLLLALNNNSHRDADGSDAIWLVDSSELRLLRVRNAISLRVILGERRQICNASTKSLLTVSSPRFTSVCKMSSASNADGTRMAVRSQTIDEPWPHSRIFVVLLSLFLLLYGCREPSGLLGWPESRDKSGGNGK